MPKFYICIHGISCSFLHMKNKKSDRAGCVWIWPVPKFGSRDLFGSSRHGPNFEYPAQITKIAVKTKKSAKWTKTELKLAA